VRQPFGWSDLAVGSSDTTQIGLDGREVRRVWWRSKKRIEEIETRKIEVEY